MEQTFLCNFNMLIKKRIYPPTYLEFRILTTSQEVLDANSELGLDVRSVLYYSLNRASGQIKPCLQRIIANTLWFKTLPFYH